jgi:hypothetical protein
MHDPKTEANLFGAVLCIYRTRVGLFLPTDTIMSSSSNVIRLLGSSASTIQQEFQDVKPLLIEEATADVEDVPCPTASAVVLTDALAVMNDWKDPFYENDASVIATFTFDYERFDRGLTRTGRALGLTLLLILAILLLNPVALLALLMFPIWILLCCVALHFSDRFKQYRRRCLHIALTESGIYVDEVSEPGSRELMRRLHYKYTDIQKCEVVRMDSCGTVTFQVVLFNLKGMRMLTIDGLIGAQRFVDLVNGMIERVPEDSRILATKEVALFCTCETI